MNRREFRCGPALRAAFDFHIALVVCLLLMGTGASAQMPDPRQMSGIPRPDPQLQSAVVTVRVIRGSLSVAQVAPVSASASFFIVRNS